MNSPQAGGITAGFSHSEISGSRPVSGSPELIAAVHVLHRLWLPRHPPYALRSLSLSLRHASRSRAGIDLQRSIRCAPSLRYNVTITIYNRDVSRHLGSLVWIFNDRVQADPASAPWPPSSDDEDCRRNLRLAVELIGIEPTTSGLQSQRSPN